MAAWHPGAWLLGRQVLGPVTQKASVPAAGVSWCSELAPDSVRTGTDSEPTPRPCSGLRAVRRHVASGKGAAAGGPRVLGREGKGFFKGLNYVSLGKGFCSEGHAERKCKFRASRGEDKGVESLADCIKVCFRRPPPWGFVSNPNRGKVGPASHSTDAGCHTAWSLFISYLFEQSYVLTIFIDLFN